MGGKILSIGQCSAALAEIRGADLLASDAVPLVAIAGRILNVEGAETEVAALVLGLKNTAGSAVRVNCHDQTTTPLSAGLSPTPMRKICVFVVVSDGPTRNAPTLRSVIF